MPRASSSPSPPPRRSSIRGTSMVASASRSRPSCSSCRLPAWLLLAKVYGLYSRDEERADHSTADEVFAVFNMLAVGTLGFYAIAYLFPGLAAIPLGKILTFLAFAIPLVVLGRASARAICRQTDAYTQNTLILGAGVIGQRVARKLLSPSRVRRQRRRIRRRAPTRPRRTTRRPDRPRPHLRAAPDRPRLRRRTRHRRLLAAIPIHSRSASSATSTSSTSRSTSSRDSSR